MTRDAYTFGHLCYVERTRHRGPWQFRCTCGAELTTPSNAEARAAKRAHQSETS